MAKFPICQICAAMLPDESVEQKHYDWHATNVMDALRARVEAEPHADTCGWWIRNRIDLYAEPNYCDCWRVKALELINGGE